MQKNTVQKSILKTMFIVFLMMLFPIISFAEVDEDFFIPEYTEEYINWMNMTEEEKSKVIEPQMYENKSGNSGESDSGGEYLIDNNMVGTTLPSKYTSPYYGINRNQKTNLCWACSAANVFETNYFFVNNTKRTFSDMHMEYMTSKTYNTNGFNRTYDIGGNINIALAYATNGMGIIDDATVTTDNFKNYNPVAKVSDYEIVSTANLKQYMYNYGVVSAYTYMNINYFSTSTTRRII